MDHHVGDVINGHVLGVDRAWHPMTYANVPSTRSTSSYGARYRARWKWTILACVVLSVLSNITHSGQQSGSTTLLSALIGAIISGSIINLVVAAIPRRRPVAHRG
jgi:hypothetical protein